MKDINMNDLFVLDKNSHIPIFSDICTFCRHLDASGERKCAAFPQEIPLAIWLGENDHRMAFPGDHGIQFEADPPVLASPRLVAAHKRRAAIRVRSEALSRLRSRIWQDPRTRQKIIEIINLKITEDQSELVPLARLPSVEAIWLGQAGAAKAKPWRRKESVTLG